MLKKRTRQHGLAIPEQQNIKNAPDISAHSVKQFIKALPANSLGDALHLSYEYIHDTNRINYEWKKRLQFLELLRPTTFKLLNAISKQTLESRLPLNDAEEQMVIAYNSLCKEMARGYKICLRHILKLPVHAQDEKVIAEVIHRTMRYISYMLLNAYQHYTKPEKENWYEMHQLYHRAEMRELVKMPVIDNEQSLVKIGSISALYIQCHLLNEAVPSRLNIKEIRQLFQVLEVWSDKIEIKRLSQGHAGLAVRVIRFNTGFPSSVKKISKEDLNNGNFRLLKTTNLVDAINDSLLHIENSETPSLKYVSSFSPKVLKQLNDSWLNKHKRAFPRRTEKSRPEIKIISGFTNIYKVVSAISGFEINTIRKRLKDTAVNPNYLSKEHLSESWKESDKIEPHRAKQQIKPTAFKSSYWQSWDIVNHSANGYRLVSKILNNARLQVGELIAINSDETSSECLIASIRWIEGIGDKQLEMGVEIIAASAIPLIAFNRNNLEKSSELEPALILQKTKVKKEFQTLLTPVNVFKGGDRLLLLGDRIIDEVNIRTFYCSSSYDRFIFIRANDTN